MVGDVSQLWFTAWSLNLVRKMGPAAFCSFGLFVFFKQALFQRMEKPANAQNDGPLHGSNRIILSVKPIIASRPQLWPRVWFMFTVNWKQWRGARLPPVCARWAAAGWVFGPAVQSRTCAFVCFVFSTPGWKACRWIEAAKCVSWSPCWKSGGEAGLAGGGNEMSGGPQVSNYIS